MEVAVLSDEMPPLAPVEISIGCSRGILHIYKCLRIVEYKFLCKFEAELSARFLLFSLGGSSGDTLTFGGRGCCLRRARRGWNAGCA
jgi:hypothetical protein